MATEKYKKYILFDLDGTLTDPKVGICTCFQYALESFGIHEPDIDKLEPVIGPPLLDSFKEFYGFSDEDAKKGMLKYRERYSTVGWAENKVYPGIKHMLKTLKKNGFHMAVASSKPKVFVEKIMEHFGLAKYFDALAGSNEDGTHTDKAEIIDDALLLLFGSKAKIDLEQVYMVGDRKFDCIGAQKKGIECIGVAYGYGDFEELMDAHADYIVFSTKELEDLLMRQTFKASQGRIAKKKGDGIEPMPFRTIMLILGASIGFILLRKLLEIIISLAAPDIIAILPEAIQNWLLYSTYVNPSSFGYIGNLGTIITGLTYLLAGATFIYPGISYIKSTKRDSYLLHPMNPTVWQILCGVVVAIAANLGLQIAASLIGAAAASAEYQEVAQSQFSCMFGVGLVVYGFAAPIVEEMIYRGIVYGAFRRYLPLPVAMIITSAIFGVYHGNIVQGIYAFAFGCLMVAMYEYFGTFWAAVAVHVLVNITTYVAAFIATKNNAFICWPLAAAMMVFAIIGGVMLVRLRKKS